MEDNKVVEFIERNLKRTQEKILDLQNLVMNKKDKIPFFEEFEAKINELSFENWKKSENKYPFCALVWGNLR